MRCTFCGNVDTQVKDSRPAEDHVAIRRRRFCPACGGRFTTYERVELNPITIINNIVMEPKIIKFISFLASFFIIYLS